MVRVWRSGSPPKSDAGPGRSGAVVLTVAVVVTREYPARWCCSPGCIAPSHQRVAFSYTSISTTIVLAPSGKSIPPYKNGIGVQCMIRSI